MINYGKQTIDKSDINSVIKVLKSDFLTTGPEINKFEKQLNLKFGSKYSTVVNSGTSALFILGKALNWKSGDTIITSPLTFVATANCIINNNARVQFVDIDRVLNNRDIGGIMKKNSTYEIHLNPNTKQK